MKTVILINQSQLNKNNVNQLTPYSVSILVQHQSFFK